MENRRPITYTFEDIKRYKQGLMNGEEMHAFEKASMEDPFLADALEGYMEADTALAEQHLSNIKEQFAERKEEKEKAVVVAMPQKRYGFMRVAAMVIVIAGAGLLTYKILDKKEVPAGEQMAQQKEPVNEIKTGETPQASAPLTSQDNEKAVTEKTKPGNGSVTTEDIKTNSIASATPEIDKRTEDANPPVINNSDKQALAEAKNDKEAQTKPAKPPLARVEEVKQDDVAVSSTNANTYKIARESLQLNNQIRGRVLTPNNQPLANANIQLDNSRRFVTTDAQGNFELNAKDSIVLATVESSGYMNTRVQLRSNTDNTINIGNIILQSDPSVENNVAVTGLGVTNKKKARVADTLTSKPEGGWESFQEYVANKLNTKVDTTGGDMKMTGELEIEFFVDANGNPKNLKVLNSTNPQLNQQAIDAVKKGPKWATRKKKARILIRY